MENNPGLDLLMNTLSRVTQYHEDMATLRHAVKLYEKTHGDAYDVVSVVKMLLRNYDEKQEGLK